ncbi:carbohydrate porin [Limnobacter litoralis]|uniref:carbohydrate porin n=1 Tax=Limnobacter litoralis TaxID=481366 RepID=UPI0024E1278B|nr:carbohydrate porin [Limnobacter litoralis]
MNSLQQNERLEETTDLTLYAGLRLSPSTEFWINPEVDQGFGVSNTVGVAGFPSGEAYKIGANAPYLRVPRAFIRSLFALPGGSTTIEGSANQLGGPVATNNVTVTLGKFSVVDVFDNNTYAHDPRNDFLNWSIIDAGAFDYAADSWGFTNGVAVEWNKNWWTLRAGRFQLSSVPNGKVTGFDFSQRMSVVEAEGRYGLGNLPGKLKLLTFLNEGRMGDYNDALKQAFITGSVPDTAMVRKRSSRAGFAMNLEQAIGSDAGIFARWSANDGRKEAYEFTEINKSFATGISVNGRTWTRPNDQFGAAVALNALSGPAKSYFASGGSGILIGDGRLNYNTEQILETFYSMSISDQVTFTVDFQHINNPAYNRDRGPVNLGAIRIHMQF